MPSVTVNVKWGKQKFENVEIDLAAGVEVFKAQLFTLTLVPPERQKIMGVKGGAVKDGADLAALGIKPGQNLMLMGSAEAAPEAPKEATIFAEDLPALDVAAMETENPGGLTNLGNTCYLNSSLQCMKAIPELTTSLQQYAGSGDPFVPALRSVITELQASNAAVEVKPFSFVSTFRQSFPMFAERTDNGQGFVQQDAEECWSTIVSTLSHNMQMAVGDAPAPVGAPEPECLPRMKALKRNLGDMLFGIEMESSYKCLEEGDASSHVAYESARKIACHISDKTAHLYTALEVNLDELIEKRSEALGECCQIGTRAPSFAPASNRTEGASSFPSEYASEPRLVQGARRSSRRSRSWRGCLRT
jgi:ubiquitin carboxyl-terminal hydrolase 14